MTGRQEEFYSAALGRPMAMRVYGHAGKPCLVFPSQDGRPWDFEGFGMIGPCLPHLEAGRLKLYCVDSIDGETWANAQAHPRGRIERHESWFRYLTDEFHPYMMADSGGFDRAMTIGCSMGATHAVNALFRRPDLFDTVIALSGAYDTPSLFGGYRDELIYLNSPIDSLRGMPADHPYVALLNSCRIILCAGRGAWEEEMLRTTRLLEDALREKGVRAWVDIWGPDVNHDWPWWRRQLQYFLDRVL